MILNTSRSTYLSCLFGTFVVFCLSSSVNGQSAYAQSGDDLKLDDSVELELPADTKNIKEAIDISELEEIDDLDALKTDIGEIIFEEAQNKKGQVDKPTKAVEKEIAAKKATKSSKGVKPVIFDVGNEERELLELSKFVEGKIPNDEWNEVATAAKVDSYEIQQGDWLWKISQRLFGSGFYYSKVWALNPQITNPHEIEPGMTLVFSTGSSSQMPEVALGSFDSTTIEEAKMRNERGVFVDFTRFGTNIKPKWIDERKELIDKGIYFQYASEDTYKDLKEVAKGGINTEYQKYEPPTSDILITEPSANYDEQGFDKNSKISFSVKEGFFLNSFVTTNIVQDFGEIYGSRKENVFIQRFDYIYVNFDKSVGVKAGDKFSIYSPGGVVSHAISDRQGYKYTVTGQLRVVKAIDEGKWECQVIELSGIVQRKDRLTTYTPKIGRIIKTFNKRNIEAAVVGSFESSAGGMSMGDVVYLDRGRSDGVEMGTVFELYSFTDRGTGKRLSADPTYKIGEIAVISLTDNFATALINVSRTPISLGTLAVTKTEEMALLAKANKSRSSLQSLKSLNKRSMDEIDIELNLDDLSSDLLEKAEKVKLTEDEIEELDRLERDKSVIKDHERDLRDLEKLEGELVASENALNESKLDEDKFLEQEDLNAVERSNLAGQGDALDSLNDIEDEFGLKYMDENLNAKENPYGLTEFDLEEIDELLNTENL